MNRTETVSIKGNQDFWIKFCFFRITPVRLNSSSKNRKGVEIIGFSLEGEIKRSDFNFAPESSTVALGDKIKINIDIEAVKK